MGALVVFAVFGWAPFPHQPLPSHISQRVPSAPRMIGEYARRIANLFADVGGDAQPEGGEVQPQVRDAAREFLAISVAIALTGGGRVMYANADEGLVSKGVEAAQPSLDSLMLTCLQNAPTLVATEESVLPLARLAAWVPREQWVRPLEEWAGPTVADGTAYTGALRSLAEHLLELWEVPSALHGALAFTGDGRSATVPEAAHRVSFAFLSAHVAVGAGTASLRDALQETIGSQSAVVVSKATAKSLVASSDSNPLHALRRAQVASRGAEDWVGGGVCASSLGVALQGSEEQGASEAFAMELISWICTHADALGEPAELATAIDYCLEMRRQDGRYSLAGRTPKTLKAAVEAYALTTIKFDRDELFQPNPRGIRGLILENATIPAGTVVRVPYDDEYNGGPGGYELGLNSSEGRGATPCTVRVAEIGSLRRLILEGQKLDNCLEDRYDSQLKYVQRARQRVSSFWSFTLTYEGRTTPVYICLAEVWHLRQGNVIRQAEGPRPRTLPGPEAWYWLTEWCEREGVDLSTWDIYSRVAAPIPPPPIL